MHDDIEVVPGTEEFGPDVAGFVRLRNRLLEPTNDVEYLAAYVDERLRARIAYTAMMTPSTSVCGLAIINGMSLQVPGSDSSALTTR